MTQISVGDIVKLKEPYSVEETRKSYEYGIVVEHLDSKSVSLHLFDKTGQLYIYPSYVEKGLMIPTYVDFHCVELELYKKAKELGYKTFS
jgi:hypothetical protein